MWYEVRDCKMGVMMWLLDDVSAVFFSGGASVFMGLLGVGKMMLLDVMSGRKM